jgi:hypothetical protein
MDKITRLQVFDFDDTLFRIPTYTSKIHLEGLGYTFNDPYEFYDHNISLDETLHNIQLIGPVYDAWKEGKEDPSCMQLLITHRVVEVEEALMKVLAARNMSFDRIFILSRKTEKVDSMKEIMKVLPNLETIEIYEDSIDQIIRYQEFGNGYNNLLYLSKKPYLNIKIYIVDKSKMYRIENVKLSEKKRIILI